MNDPGVWPRQLLTQGARKLLPVEVALGAASAPPVWPSALGRREDRFEPLAIATDTSVLVVASQWRAQGPLRLLEWRLAILPTPGPYPLHTPAPPCPDRLALDAPVSTAGRGPIGGKAQQGDCPLAPCRGGAVWRPLARTQHRLCGLNGPAQALKTLRQDGHDPVGVRFARAAEDTIIGTTRHTAPALHPGLPHRDAPFVPDIRQAYVGSYG